MLNTSSALINTPVVSYSDAVRFRVSPVSLGLYRMEVAGRLPLGWAGFFSNGLASKGINVISGVARKEGTRIWKGEFEVESSERIGRVLGLGLSEIMIAGAAELGPVRCSPVIDGYKVRECVKSTGAFYIEIEGDDCRGFLGEVLKTFAVLSLFPVDMSITTNGSRVHDSFHLMSEGGACPASKLKMVLAEMLDLMRMPSRNIN